MVGCAGQCQSRMGLPGAPHAGPMLLCHPVHVPHVVALPRAFALTHAR